MSLPTMAAKRTFPISVDEALQFTPLTTSVLPAQGTFHLSAFSHHSLTSSDSIPLPTLVRAGQHLHLVPKAERKVILRTWEQQASSEHKDRLKLLLDPDAVNQIKFKQQSSGSVVDRTQQTSSLGKRKRTPLSPIAKTILESSSVDYRCSGHPLAYGP